MVIQPISAFSDNYIWSIEKNGSAVVVDPGDATTVFSYLQENSLELTGILITHHHADHIGGVVELLQKFSIPVYAPASGNYSFPHVKCAQDDSVFLESVDATFSVLEVPGHTLDHIAYYGEGAVFCGDTLFAGGCGRIFEGTPEMMFGSLQKLAELPEETLVYCAHEYTLANLAFAETVEADNVDLNNRINAEKEKREQGLPTVPSTVALELQTNPFLRADCSEFAKRRALKDCF